MIQNFLKKKKKQVKKYFAPTSKVRVRDFVRETPGAALKMMKSIKKEGAAGPAKTISRNIQKTKTFKPVANKVRARDVVSNIPTGIGKTANKIAQDATRFAISAYEVPSTLRKGKAKNKFYNTPVGRINSFQSESQNRVKRGDPLWKAIGNPAIETVFGAADIGAVAKPALKAIRDSRLDLGEVQKVSKDLLSPVTQKQKIVSKKKVTHEPVEGIYVGGKKQMRELPEPRYEKVAKEITVPRKPESKLLQGIMQPGMRVKDISKNKNTLKINATNARKNAHAKTQLNTVVSKGVDVPLVKNRALERTTEGRKMAQLSQKNNTSQKTAAIDVKELLEKKSVKDASEYNKYQKAAYGKKKSRLSRLKEIGAWSKTLQSSGYRAQELKSLDPIDGRLMAKMIENGFPKKAIDDMKYNRDRMQKIADNNVKYTSLNNYYKHKEAIKTHYLDDIDPKQLLDINPVMGGFRDATRNFEKAFGSEFPKIKERLLDPFDDAKGRMFTEQRALLDDLENTVVKKLGIKPGSKESELVQKYGEGLITITDLKEASPKKWKNIIKADEYFKAQYDTLLDDLNLVREANYPTHPMYPESSSIIPKRKNYYRHFRDMTGGVKALMNLFETSSGIDPRLAAISQTTKPLKKWLSFAQKREGNKTEYDAVSGFVDYLKAHGYSKHVDPYIRKFRGADDEVRRKTKQMARDEKSEYLDHENFGGLVEELTGNQPLTRRLMRSGNPKETLYNDLKIEEPPAALIDDLRGAKSEREVSEAMERHLRDEEGRVTNDLMRYRQYSDITDGRLNNFMKFLDSYGSELAGKTSGADRWLQERIGRKTMGVLKLVNNRVKANTIVGNLSSSVAQWFNFPNGVASAGVKNSLLGSKDFLVSTVSKNDSMIDQSTFIRERYFNDYEKFDKSMLLSKNVKKLAVWITGIGDEVATKTMWHAHYHQALSKGDKNPVRYADDWTRRMVAGRGIGEVPIDQKATLIQLVAPFQLEVANQWYALKDIARKNNMKPAAVVRAYATWALTGYMMNTAAKEIRGSNVSLDPIDAMIEGHETYRDQKEKGNPALGAGLFAGRMAGEALSNIPFGQQVAASIPKEGLRIGPKNEDGEREKISREKLFGEGDPTRFGGGLLAMRGLKDPAYYLGLPYGGSQVKKTVEGIQFVDDGAERTDEGDIKYLAPTKNLDQVQSMLFGKYAAPEARAYYEFGTTPLSGKQTERIDSKKSIPAKRKEYLDIMKNRVDEGEEDPFTPVYEAGKEALYETSEDTPTGLKRLGLTLMSMTANPVESAHLLLDGEPIRKMRFAGDNPLEKIVKFPDAVTVTERMKGNAKLDGGNPDTDVDHIIPKWLGGREEESNLQVLAKEEHKQKTALGDRLRAQFEAGDISKKDAKNEILKFNESLGGSQIQERKKKELKDSEENEVLDTYIPTETKDIATEYEFDQYFADQRPEGLQEIQWEKKQKTKAKDLYTDKKYAEIDEKTKEEIWSQMGYTKDDVEVFYLGSVKRSAGNAAVAPHVWDKLESSHDYPETLNKMLDEKILTEPLLKEMYAQDLVDSDDYGMLIRAIKNGSAYGKGEDKDTDEGTSKTKKSSTSSKSTKSKSTKKSSEKVIKTLLGKDADEYRSAADIPVVQKLIAKSIVRPTARTSIGSALKTSRSRSIPRATRYRRKRKLTRKEIN